MVLSFSSLTYLSYGKIKVYELVDIPGKLRMDIENAVDQMRGQVVFFLLNQIGHGCIRN